ncbi:MAG: hypothetical protein KAT77_03340 [Nanoarchaeota archaeon]|nr:hypothetical protein [Nanoarchaeota archaeon]
MKKTVPLAILLALGCSSEKEREPPYIPPPPITIQVTPEFPQAGESFIVDFTNASSLDLDIATDSTDPAAINNNDGIPNNDRDVIADAAGSGTGIIVSPGLYTIRAFGERSSLDQFLHILDNHYFDGAADFLPPGVVQITLADWAQFVQPFLYQDPNIPEDTVTQLNTIAQTLLTGQNILSYGVNERVIDENTTRKEVWWELATTLPGYTDSNGDSQVERWVLLGLNNTHPYHATGALDDALGQAFTPQSASKAWNTIAQYAPSLCVKGTPITPTNPKACNIIWPATGADSVPISLPTGTVYMHLAYDWSIDGIVNGPAVTMGFFYGVPDAANQSAIDLFRQTYRDQGIYRTESNLVLPTPSSGKEKISKLDIRKIIEQELDRHRTNNS